jgi:hypothetical protein
MANVKISGLPAASAVADANEFEINEAGTSKKVTSSQIATYVGDEIGALTSSDLGTTVQPYDIDTAKYDATTANFTGTLQNGGSNVVVDTDIGSTVQAYDADTAKYDDTTANFTGTLQNGGSNVVVDSDIGSTVQGYDADIAKYDDTTANFTGILQQNGTNVLLDSDINSTVQAYDADTTKNDVSNTFTTDQNITGVLNLPATTTEARSIEIGKNRTGDGFAYLDLIGDATYSDYGARFIRNNTGADTTTDLIHRGTGALRITAQDAGYVDLRTNNIRRLSITPNGGFSTGNSVTAYGTSGQVLTSTGDAPPTWQDASGGGGAWDVLNVTDITASTNTIIWDFSTWSSYETFKLIFAQAKPSNDNAELILEWGDDGASFSSNRDGNESTTYNGFAGASVTDAHVIALNVGTAGGEEGVHGELTFMGFNQSGLRGHVFGPLAFVNGSAQVFYISQSTLTDAENSIRLSMGTAFNETIYNFVDGTFTLLGLKTS